MKRPAKPMPGGAQRSIWLIAGSVALFAAVFFLWLFSRPVAPAPAAASTPPGPPVGLTRLDSGATGALVREQAELLDPTPLFLPTQWNAQPRRLSVDAARGSESAFAAFDAVTFFNADSLSLAFPADAAVPAHPVDSLSVGVSPRPLEGLGRVDVQMEPLLTRGAFVEVWSEAAGESVLAEELPGAAAPSDNWAPLEFLVSTDAMGLVGLPQVTHSSGNDAVDAYFRSFLTDQFKLGARLRSGNFRVLVGP